MTMRILGIDFTSRPDARKPLTCAEGRLSGAVLAIDAIHEWADFDGFEAMLGSPGPWLAAVDFPFGLPAAFVTAVGWPPAWQDYLACVARLDRQGFRSLVVDFKASRPEGNKDLRREIDGLARAASPLNVVNPPVGFMFFEGAPRIWRSDAAVLPMRPRRTDRVAVEAYPALVARWAIGARSYKGGKADSHPLRRALRGEVIERIGGAAAEARYGVRARLTDVPMDAAITDPLGDGLDAVLCAVQGAWAWHHRDSGFGIPDRGNRHEGWVTDPGLCGISGRDTLPCVDAGKAKSLFCRRFFGGRLVPATSGNPSQANKKGSDMFDPIPSRRVKGVPGLAAAVVAVGLAAWMPPVTAPAHADEIETAIVHGGRLYDDWHLETKEPTPEASHPAYPSSARFASDPQSNWRCIECHGWDYKGKDGAYGPGSPHFTGIKGIRGMAGADPAAIVAVLKDDTHAYAGLMADKDFEDLAAFISRGQVDMDQYIDSKTRKAKGDPLRRATYYKVICANCHGLEGHKVRTMPPLGTITRENPWASLHKMLNGHPNETMPALRVFPIQDLVDILAYVQSLPAEEKELSIVRGGRLYDNWYKETMQPPPVKSHPAYPRSAKYARDPRHNWRCKECHGWDYKGSSGNYGKGSRHYTGIKGIDAMAGADASRILAVLLDDTHQYGDVLDNHDLLDLANFVSHGQMDVDQHIDAESRKAKGNAARHDVFYKTICASCHGLDGLKILTMPPLGRIARDNPWVSLHKILHGHPAENMPALRVLEIPTLVNVLAYIQTLPDRK